MRRIGALTPVARAIATCRTHYIAAAALSGLGNLLCLTPTIFMLQVYDRVVPTAGLGTLALLALVALAAYATLGMFEWLRTRLLVKAGVRLDHALAGPLLATVLSRPALDRVARAEALRDLDGFRQAMAGPVMMVVFDAPWMPIYVIAAFLLNPWLGLLTLVAGAVLLLLALDNERATHRPVAAASAASAAAYARQAHMTAHASEVRSLGMRRALTAKALDERVEVNALQLHAALSGGRHTTLIRTIRLVLQSAGLALGAWLAIDQKISAGAIFAVTVLMSRALSPIEQLTGSWRTVIRARECYARLNAMLTGHGEEPVRTLLPPPQGRITVENLVMTRASSGRLILSGINFDIAPGEVVGIAGLSGAGKSTLLAGLAGALPLRAGSIRFDGASLDAWDPERLAHHIGFLPQDFVLFSGTVKENISRFAGALGANPAEVDAGVIASAKAIGAHDMILRLPDGYETQIGQSGTGLSAGQSQRIALARALYGRPSILLLDEPYAHLDAEGQTALLTLVMRLKQERTTVVIAAHQADVLTACDKVLLLAGGRLARFGPLMPAPQAVQRLEEQRA